MANQIEGVVEGYYVKGTSNGGVRHSVKIGGSYYSVFAKDDKPRANKGDTVSFQAYENNGYWNIKGPINVLKRASGHQQGGEKQKQYAANDDERQQSIVRQSCTGYAATIVSAAVQNGSMKGLTVDELAEEVIRIANDYLYPFAMEGKKPEFKGAGVSDMDPIPEEDPDDNIPF